MNEYFKSKEVTDTETRYLFVRDGYAATVCVPKDYVLSDEEINSKAERMLDYRCGLGR